MLRGDELKDARLRAGLTQERLSELVEVTLRSVGNWERAPRVPRAAELKVRSILGAHLEEGGREVGVPLRDATDVELLAEIARRFARRGGDDGQEAAATSRAGVSPATVDPFAAPKLALRDAANTVPE